MALNPFFINGAFAEQNLLQDLVNEHLKMFGIDIFYIPRMMIRTDNILREVQSSKFEDNFIIEAYVNNYEGYAGAGDIMTKFGVSLKDEVTLTISKERFEEVIAPILTSGVYNPNLYSNDPDLIKDIDISRPREGDLIYFPLGERLFEIKFVEHEKPFYQLGKLYAYELVCELFEYEDEIMDTSIEEVDELIKDVTSTLYLIDKQNAKNAIVRVAAGTSVGYAQKIILNNDGYGYTSVPTITISNSPLGVSTSAANAKAVAITTSHGGVYSIKEILITNTGFGYTEPPTVTITGGGGAGAAATCLINLGIGTGKGLSSLFVQNPGKGYYTLPIVQVNQTPTGIGATDAIIVPYYSDPAVGILNFGFRDAGNGYNVTASTSEGGLGGGGNYASEPTISIESPTAINANTGTGTFKVGETIVGSSSGSTAIVRDWNINNKQMLVSILSGSFIKGETIVGAATSAIWTLEKFDDFITEDPFAQNDEIENAGIDILDFNEDNPFGTY